MTTLTPADHSALTAYTSCDISDALHKLKLPSAGFLADLIPILPLPETSLPFIAPISTVLFHPLTHPSAPPAAPGADLGYTPIPKGGHFADEVEIPEGGVVVLGTSVGHEAARDVNALVGGLVGLRMKMRGARAVIVDGRVRDLQELKASGLGVWARGTSTVGAGAGHKCLGVGGEVKFGRVSVKNGDVVFVDEGGVVVIPGELVGRVVEMLPVIVGADERVREDVKRGGGLAEAFARHRGKL